MIPHLGHLLTLEARAHAPDGAGGYLPAWVAVGQIWAQVVAADARDADRPGALVATQALRITVRGAPRGSPRRPAPGQRFRHGDRVYPITSVRDEDARGRFLVCRAHEELAA